MVLEQFHENFLTGAVFVWRAYAALEALDEHQYWMRLGTDGAKEQVDKVLPLAALLTYLERPDRRVRCRYVGRGLDQAVAL